MTRPALLDTDTVDAWREAHRAWFARDGHLAREVTLKSLVVRDDLLEAVGRMSERLEHHAVVSIEGDVVTFELWTHDRGGLTHLDLDFAEGLDRLVTERLGPNA